MEFEENFVTIGDDEYEAPKTEAKNDDFTNIGFKKTDESSELTSDAKDDDFTEINSEAKFDADFVDNLIDNVNEDIAALDEKATDDDFEPIGDDEDDTDYSYAIPDENDTDAEDEAGIIWDDDDDFLNNDDDVI